MNVSDSNASQEEQHMSVQTTMHEALKSALELEAKGFEYYRDVAEKAKNPLTTEVFKALADQELVHMETIQKMYDSANLEGVTLGDQDLGMEKMIRSMFGRFSSQQRKAWEMDNSEAYDYAKELERGSIALYTKLAGESDNPQEKTFFESLTRAEESHLNALDNVSFYLMQTGDWFASDEGRVWNWMNT
jgi:rubrerythrin